MPLSKDVYRRRLLRMRQQNSNKGMRRVSQIRKVFVRRVFAPAVVFCRRKVSVPRVSKRSSSHIPESDVPSQLSREPRSLGISL
jgi:hypothetical protein